MKDIGGYLEFERCRGLLLHDGAIALNSGRNCLAYLIRKRGIQKIYIPRFLCSSVENVCRQEGVEIEFYSINEKFLPDIDFKYDGWIYFVNYYGQISNDTISAYKAKYGKIIVDNVQAYFQKPCDSIDTIYTCRKFFGVPDGAFLCSEVGMDEKLPRDFSYARLEHLAGRFEKEAPLFYPQFLRAEDEIANLPIRRMSVLTENLLRAVKYDYVSAKRTENFDYLAKTYKSTNKLDVVTPIGPYMYPLYVEDGSVVRKKLQQKRIYIPTLWPDVLKICTENDLEYDMALNILPIPVDQRYGIEDMEYIVSTLNQSLRELM